MKKGYTETEKEEYVKKFQTSGLSAEAFAKANNVGISTINRWRKKYAQEAFGKIELSNSNITETLKENASKNQNETKKHDIAFVTENIELYLKPGYDKEILKNIVEVLTTNDNQFIKRRKSNIHSIWCNRF